MAKNKYSTALFEVMARNPQEGPPPAPGVLASIASWWGSRRGSSVEGVGPAAIADPSPVEPFQTRPQMAALAIDPHRRLVLLRLSYTSAAICMMAMATTVAAAYLVGRRSESWSAQRDRPVIADVTTEQLRAGPAVPEVTNVRHEPVTVVLQRDPPGSPASNPNQPLIGPNRQVGLNYVVIQSYPEEKMAQQAVAALQQAGVGATIERKLPGWTASGQWYAVVGIHGFNKIRDNPEYDKYLSTIKKVSDQYAKPKSFRAFNNPQPYKWPR
jgi:hypothetical protein